MISAKTPSNLFKTQISTQTDNLKLKTNVATNKRYSLGKKVQHFMQNNILKQAKVAERNH